MLQGFEIEGFRTFRHVLIDRLARVNLIVGRNNVGKTMLLEALRFYVSGDLSTLACLLRDREEVVPPVPSTGYAGGVLHFEALAHNRPSKLVPDAPIVLREPREPGRELRLGIDTATQRIHANRSGHGWGFSWHDFLREGAAVGRPVFVPPAAGVTSALLGWLWDDLVLRGGEDRVVQCLQIIASVERITLIQDPRPQAARVAMARLTGRAEPVPLKSLGDGVLRVFHLAMALERSLADDASMQDYALDEHMLLVDEIETGIHYSALPDLWRFVFRAARERDVQVFATTHSWDCIEAFQQASSEELEGSAELIRLEQKGDEHRAVLFGQDELPTVTKRHVEVR